MLALVEPAGPACHTGERTCFHSGRARAAPRRTRRCPASSARSPSARGTGLLHGHAARPTAFIGAKVEEEAEEVARAAREETDERVAEEAADVLYHLTVLLAARGLSLATPRRCSLSGAAELASADRRDHADARGGPRPRRQRDGEHRLIPITQTVIEDTETPVSAFLKLRGDGPAFLLESAEQGQRVGRWSFIGYKPRSVLRWSLADGGDPYALAAAEAVAEHRQAIRPDLPPFAGGAVGFFGYDCVRAVERLPGAQPGPARAARHGADALRRASSPSTTSSTRRRCSPTSTPTTSTPATRAPSRRSPRCASGSPARCPRAAAGRAPTRPRSSSNMPREAFEAMVARIVEYVHAGDAFQVVPSQRWSAAVDRRAVLDLPRPARGQPVAVHVLPGLRGLPDRRRLARAAASRSTGRRVADAPDRRHAPARRRRRGGRGASPRSCSPTRRSAPST